MLHAAAREPGHRYLNTTAAGRSARRDLKLVLEVNIDVHQDPEHDVLKVSGLLRQPCSRVRPHIHPRSANQRHDPVRGRSSCQFHGPELSGGLSRP